MTLLVLGKDGTTRTFGGPVHPPSDVLIADSALCTMQLVAKDAGGKIVDACTAVAISAGDDRFFAFTARHASALGRNSPRLLSRSGPLRDQRFVIGSP